MESIDFAIEANGTCLLSGAPAEISRPADGRSACVYRSRPCGTYEVSRTLAASTGIWEQVSDRLHLIAGLSRRYSDAGRPLVLHTGHLSDEDAIQSLLAGIRAPTHPLEQIDELLLWVYDRANRAGESAWINERLDYTIIFATSSEEFAWILAQAIDLGLIRKIDALPEGLLAVDTGLTLTLEGWKRILALRSERPTSNQAFVAMSFADDLKSVWVDAIEPALEENGWDAVRVDGIEHNEKIDDLIISEIRKSGLLIADFTGHRQNVYFEAGFARGLGIPVIWLCREDEIGKAHLDTRQFNHIVWSTPADLREKLRLRILATIPVPSSVLDRLDT